MKKVKLFASSFIAIALLAACGGETNENETKEEVKEDVVEVLSYNIDTAATVINWTGFKGGDHTIAEDYHSGTISALSGSVEITTTNGNAAITGGELVVDMNSISDENGIEKLETHLKDPDFFDINQFGTSKFTFGSFENGTLAGTLTVLGKDYPIESTVNISQNENGVEITVDEFLVDFSDSGMGFLAWADYSGEIAEDQINPNFVFSATVVAKK